MAGSFAEMPHSPDEEQGAARSSDLSDASLPARNPEYREALQHARVAATFISSGDLSSAAGVLRLGIKDLTTPQLICDLSLQLSDVLSMQGRRRDAIGVLDRALKNPLSAFEEIQCRTVQAALCIMEHDEKVLAPWIERTTELIETARDCSGGGVRGQCLTKRLCELVQVAASFIEYDLLRPVAFTALRAMERFSSETEEARGLVLLELFRAAYEVDDSTNFRGVRRQLMEGLEYDAWGPNAERIGFDIGILSSLAALRLNDWPESSRWLTQAERFVVDDPFRRGSLTQANAIHLRCAGDLVPAMEAVREAEQIFAGMLIADPLPHIGRCIDRLLSTGFSDIAADLAHWTTEYTALCSGSSSLELQHDECLVQFSECISIEHAILADLAAEDVTNDVLQRRILERALLTVLTDPGVNANAELYECARFLKRSNARPESLRLIEFLEQSPDSSLGLRLSMGLFKCQILFDLEDTVALGAGLAAVCELIESCTSVPAEVTGGALYFEALYLWRAGNAEKSVEVMRECCETLRESDAMFSDIYVLSLQAMSQMVESEDDQKRYAHEAERILGVMRRNR